MTEALKAFGGGELVGFSDPSGVIIDNRTGLDDAMVQSAIADYWTDVASFQLGQPTGFQTYATSGEMSMVNRQPFRTPGNIFDEIALARTFADTDDDVGSAIDGIIALAYGKGMQNFHEDEQTVNLFNKACRHMHLDGRLKEMYREYLIAGQFTTVSFFTRSRLSFFPEGATEEVTQQVSVPLIGILPSENIRVVDTDLLGTGGLAFKVTNESLERWLTEYFSENTTAARKNAMRQEQPVLTTLFTERLELPFDDLLTGGEVVFRLNPRMAHRTTMPKGASPYPRPLLTRNFALLEAKRLLNIMDYALLQGGTNYIVIAKKGSDQLPAMPAEIHNLRRQVQSLGRSGVMVGDHRLSIEVVTPDLSELLEPTKRKLLGSKITAALLRRPELNTDAEGGAEAARGETAWVSEVITSDRHDIKRHVEGNQYEEMARRNRATFKRGAPKLWHPTLVLANTREFWDYVLKLRDRGDIPRKWSVEVGGFDYEAGVQQRRREIERGDDEILIPGEVPFNEPGSTPGDTPEGRPSGTSPDNGRPGSRTRSQVSQPQRRRPRGEPIRASYDRDEERTIRIGELTAGVLDQYPDADIGRVTEIERDAATSLEALQRGPIIAVPVNPSYEVTELRAVVLDSGVRLIVGNRRSDGAIVAKALCFKDSDFDPNQAEERAMRWGFEVPGWLHEEDATEQPDVTVTEPSFMQIVASAMSNPEVGQTIAALASAAISRPGLGEALASAFANMPAPQVVLPSASAAPTPEPQS